MAIGIFIFVVLIIAAAIGAVVFRNTWRKINRDQRRIEWLSSRQFVLLMIQVPKYNDKTPLAAEQMFASLHGIQQAASEFQEHISFEIVAQGSNIRFYIFCPVHLRDFVEGQIYAQYPAVDMVKVDDYTKSVDLTREHIVGTELEMTKSDVYPIKTFTNFTVDPLAGITAPLGKLEDEEMVWIQMLVRPIDDTWQARGTKLINDIRSGNVSRPTIAGGVIGGITSLATDVVREAARPGSIIAPTDKGAESAKLSGSVESGLKGIEEKITKLGFSTKVRIVSIARDMYSAQGKVMGVVGAFKQFNTTNLNGFTAKQMVADSKQMFDQYVARSFEDEGLILNIEELASLFHLPNITVETPNIVWTRAKKGEPPSTLPIVGQIPSNMITRIGKTNFRNSEKEFGIKLSDRRRHTYVIGKSGTGKSTLLENMIIDDINEGRGVILVDPHGETYEHVLTAVPEHRIKDCILFDPADRMNPIGFNLLETVDEDLKGIIASGFVGIFEKMFSNSWGPRLEHILRNTVLALLDYPDSTMLGIPKMLTDKKYRQDVVSHVKDPVIKDFWDNEFASWDAKFAAEAVAPILNKVGQFIAASTIRNIVGQAKSTFDVRKVMDEGKILLINLSRGKIGEDNSAMLGAMMITKIQLAAMSRADSPEETRTDSYLYVDEFQNFATKSFATILSEARKYHLNLIMANQYIAQMPEEVRDAVFGNVGTIIAFRVGAGDAAELVKEFTPEFVENDLVNQDIHKIYIKLSIDGLTGQSFSADTLRPIHPDTNFSAQISEHSRAAYTRHRDDVEAEIASQSGMTQIANKKMNPVGEDGTIALPSIKLNPRNIINGMYYKEMHSKGGVRWWEGVPLEKVVEEEDKKRQKFLSKRVEYLKNGGVGEAPQFEDGISNIESRITNRAVDSENHGASVFGEAVVGGQNPKSETQYSRFDIPSSKVGDSSQTLENKQDVAIHPKQNSQGEGSRSASNARATEGLTDHSLKNESKQGSPLGEGEQIRNSGIIADQPQTIADQAETTQFPKNTQKLSQNLQIDANDSDLLKSPEFELRAGLDASVQELPEPDHAHNEQLLPPEHASKAPESPTSPENHAVASNARPTSILQHFMSHADADSVAHKDENEQKSAAQDDNHSSSAAHPTDELIEGVPQSF